MSTSEALSGPAFTAAWEQLEAEDPLRARIIQQYREVAGVFVELWREIDQRTESSVWRKDGVGNCHVSPHLFETYVDGAVNLELEDLWLARGRDVRDISGFSTCRFHREGYGCILEDLKSPRCIAEVDHIHATEIRERFGVELPDFKGPLMQIQLGGMDVVNGDFSLHPEVNDELVEQTVAETRTLIDHIVKFPILHPTSGEIELETRPRKRFVRTKKTPPTENLSELAS